MISPSLVIADVISRLEDSRAALKITGVEEINEDFTSNLRPPYVTVHADFENEAEQLSSASQLIEIPVEIKLVIFTAGHRNQSDAFNQAFQIAAGALNTACGIYEISGETIRVMPRPKPFEIWAKKKDSSVIMVSLFYLNRIL